MRFRWSIEYDADDTADAQAQADDARGAFHSYHSDSVEQVEVSAEGAKPEPEPEA